MKTKVFNLKLTSNQWARMSEIFGNLSILAAATLVIPYILEKLNPNIAISGILITFILWYTSIVLARKY